MTTPEPFSVRQFAGVLRRRRLVLIQTVLIVGLAAFVLGLRAPSRYEASAVLLTGDAKTISLPGLGDAQSLSPGTAARLVRTRQVAERVRRAVAADLSVDDLLGSISTSANADGFTTVTAHGGSGSEAALLANAFANQFVALRAETPYVGLRKAVRAIQRQLKGSAGSERAALLSQLAQLRTAAALPAADVEVIDPAVAPGSPSSPNLLFAIVAGVGLGLLLGVAVALTLEALDPRIKAFSELQRLVRAPQLAGIPADIFQRPLRGRKEPRVLRAARRYPGAFERLRTSLLVFNAERDLKTVLVTSPRDEREGKTTVAGNLAISLAKVGLRVCAVDADLRGPRLARHFGLAETPGLAEVLEGERLDVALQSFPIPGLPSFLNGNGRGPKTHDLYVLSAGEPNARARPSCSRARRCTRAHSHTSRSTPPPRKLPVKTSAILKRPPAGTTAAATRGSRVRSRYASAAASATASAATVPAWRMRPRREAVASCASAGCCSTARGSAAARALSRRASSRLSLTNEWCRGSVMAGRGGPGGRVAGIGRSEAPLEADCRRFGAMLGRVELRNRDRDAEPFTTKDGSEIRELMHAAKQSLAEAIVAPGQVTERHYHVASEELYYVLEGSGELELDGELRRVGPGDAVLIPPGARHSFTGGPGGARFLCCCAPPYSHDDTVLS